MNPVAIRSAAPSILLSTVVAPLQSLFLSRTYRAQASAAAQLQSDYCECTIDRWDPPLALDSDGDIPGRSVHWAFIGDPRTKKHLYAEMISKLLEVPRISISSLVRQEINPRSLLYKEIANAVNQGKLVPESIIFGFLSNRLKDGYCRGETGFILDGIPRTRLQAEILDQLADINLVVNFKCAEGLKQPSEEAESPMSEFYKQQIELLEEYYRNQNKLIDFQVGSAPRETWKGLLSLLQLQHLNAAHSSHMIDTGLKKH